MREKSINDVWPQIAEQSEGNARGVELWKKYLKEVGAY